MIQTGWKSDENTMADLTAVKFVSFPSLEKN